MVGPPLGSGGGGDSHGQEHRAHRPAQAGKKAEKKDVAKGKDMSGGRKGFNEKVRRSRV